MRNRSWLLSAAVLVLLGITDTHSWRTVGAQQIATDQTRSYRSPWQRMDEVAKLENPADGDSVRALIEETLNFPHTFSLKLPVMHEIVEERLVQAEINYRLGRNPGIEEKTVVQIGNALADKLKLPEYAYVTVHQVEVLRFGMEMSMPSFMGEASPQSEVAGAHAKPSELSPAQATQILLVLIDQKLINPDYQLTPEEWEKTRYQPAMDRLLKAKELRDSGELAKMKPQAVVTAYSIKNDLRRQISQAVYEMSLTDGLDLVTQAFNMAGISR
jgi:hypothetical protein